MLDTKARKYFDPLLHRTAELLIGLNVKADQITAISFILGLGAAFCVLGDFRLPALILLWTSGLMDALDGTVARKMGSSSPWGALLDLTFDRLVELSLILGLGLSYAYALLPLLFLTSAIVFSMTVFLAVGALTPRRGNKAFRYQAGLAERTEGFMFFSLMILFPGRLRSTALLFAALVTFTGLQRINEARKLLKRPAPADKGQ